MSSLHLAQAIDLIHAHSGDGVVVCSGYPLAFWLDQQGQTPFMLPVVDCEGDTLPLALGIALARPQHKVIVLQSSESMRASLPSLATVGHNYPTNLFHFVFALVSDIPSPELDFVAIAAAAGYLESQHFADLELFASEISSFLASAGPKFACLDTVTPVFKHQLPHFLFRNSLSSIKKGFSTLSRKAH
jgi:hypothetical protein